MQVSGQLHAPADLPLEPTEQVTGWAPDVWSFGEEKNLLPRPGFERRNVHSAP